MATTSSDKKANLLDGTSLRDIGRENFQVSWDPSDLVGRPLSANSATWRAQAAASNAAGACDAIGTASDTSKRMGPVASRLTDLCADAGQQRTRRGGEGAGCVCECVCAMDAMRDRPRGNSTASFVPSNTQESEASVSIFRDAKFP